MRGLVLLLVVSSSVAAPAPARAEEAAVRAVRIVVPTARARKRYGGQRLTRSLRKTLAEGVAAVIPAQRLRAAQRRLGLKGRRRWTKRTLARAGREIGADYVLYTRITRKGWLYTARARLVNTATNEVQMDFRSQFFDPVKETTDRGERIGRRTLLKMQTLAEEGRLLATGAAAPTSPSAPLAPAPPPVSPPAPVAPAPPPAVPAAPPVAARPAPAGPDDADLKPGPSVRSGASSASPQPAPGPPPSAPAVAVDARPAGAPPADSELLRIAVMGGAGLLRRYDLSSANVSDSGLSYPLDPTSLVAANVDIVWPGLPLGTELDLAFRPVQYEVGPVGQPPDTPSGLLVNGALWLTYHLPLAGAGRDAVRLIPKVGARLDVASVDEHPANFVVSTSALAVAGGLGFRWPVNRTLELGFAADGGWIASYSESPTASGGGGTGFVLGGEIEARVWLSELIGIAFDSRYQLARISFDGRPSRQVPDSEVDQLENVTVSTQDLLASIGVVLRI